MNENKRDTPCLNCGEPKAKTTFCSECIKTLKCSERIKILKSLPKKMKGGI